MFDLPYILTHPVLKAIYQRHAELVEEAQSLPRDSKDRKSIEKRIAKLEMYRLPKPTASEQELTPIVDGLGQRVGHTSSLRRRFKATKKGRPEEHGIKVRAALEEKLAQPDLTWQDLAKKRGFNSAKDLERLARLLKALLKREGIPLPTPSDYRRLRESFE